MTSTTRPLRAAGVRVPGSTSNLGAGFDCIGLAVRRYLYAAYEPGPEPLRLERAGTLRALDDGARSGNDLLVRAFRDRLHEHGIGADCGGTLRVRSEIPIGRGLGSSAAAIVAGLALAEAAAAAMGTAARTDLAAEAAAAGGGALGAGGPDGGPDRAAILGRAVEVEGHPDNAGPAIFGGLVAIATAADGAPRVLRPPLSEALGLAYAAPATTIPTAAARLALPQSVPHSKAVRTAGRMAALLHGIAHADPEALRIGFADELHVPYRLPLIPGAEAAMRAGREAGAWAVTISGAGSGLIAACPVDAADDVARAMGDAFRESTAGPARADMRGEVGGATGEDDTRDAGHSGDAGDAAGARRMDDLGVIAFTAPPDHGGLRVEPDPSWEAVEADDAASGREGAR